MPFVGEAPITYFFSRVPSGSKQEATTRPNVTTQKKRKAASLIDLVDDDADDEGHLPRKKSKTKLKGKEKLGAAHRDGDVLKSVSLRKKGFANSSKSNQLPSTPASISEFIGTPSNSKAAPPLSKSAKTLLVTRPLPTQVASETTPTASKMKRQRDGLAFEHSLQTPPPTNHSTRLFDVPHSGEPSPLIATPIQRKAAGRLASTSLPTPATMPRPVGLQRPPSSKFMDALETSRKLRRMRCPGPSQNAASSQPDEIDMTVDEDSKIDVPSSQSQQMEMAYNSCWQNPYVVGPSNLRRLSSSFKLPLAPSNPDGSEACASMSRDDLPQTPPSSEQDGVIISSQSQYMPGANPSPRKRARSDTLLLGEELESPPIPSSQIPEQELSSLMRNFGPRLGFEEIGQNLSQM
ncbi:hypothetical protein BDQ12DRAFT_170317 [Crucibulum laeve]|uniref:Uncharacterized protein n=1 Tax=Crucibulum laeve TaxID=68775 RepID=A0A5C3MF33_9AGAR|nr:hypothetical protein BDQ12DRAFT_170317 [Crucibulum laeve]